MRVLIPTALVTSIGFGLACSGLTGLDGVGDLVFPWDDNGVIYGLTEEEIAAAEAALQPTVFDHVVLVSVDGLPGRFIEDVGLDNLPNFDRLAEGAYTLKAYADPYHTLTLPNHVDIVTGRVSGGETGHGWLKNVMPKSSQTLHSNNQNVDYIHSIFDRAHDNNVRTSLLSTKKKFVLFQQSYAMADQSVLDEFDSLESTTEVIDKTISVLSPDWSKTLTLVHLAETDVQGHTHGWSVEEGTPYLTSLHNIDDAIGVLLDHIENSAHLNGSTSVVLTSDHGGGEPSHHHKVVTSPDNFIIPLFIWTGTGGDSRDLYELNRETRHQTEGTNPAPPLPPNTLPPIRNADVANLALGMMGFDAVEGSVINVEQDLAYEDE